MTTEMPVDIASKVPRGELAPGCPVHRDAGDVWRIQDFAHAREFLRHPDTEQAGFGAEHVGKMSQHRKPVLYRDGEEHREHRRQTAKYFTPRRVDASYRDLMNRIADEQCAALLRRGEADLADLSFRLAVDVVGEVLGLTEAGPGMAKRLERFFREGRGTLDRLVNTANVLLFLHRDVRPSIKARRRQRRDDLISHLIDEGCSDRDILGECVTFGAAGMVTTREFIIVAAWHLFDDPALRERFTRAGEPERVAILHEILRLEPVVSDLLRTTTAPITLAGRTIPAGATVDVGVSSINLDPATAGPDPGSLCPARPVTGGMPGSGLSFGDGPHRCPGAHIAIQETDIFLSRLFALPGLRLVGTPEVRIRPEIKAYEIKGLRVRADAPA